MSEEAIGTVNNKKVKDVIINETATKLPVINGVV